MCLFRKKKSDKQKVVADIEIIKANKQTVDVLLVYAADSEEIKDSLRKIQEELKYMNPVNDANVQRLDEKISGKLSDLKIFLNKCHQRQNYEGWREEIRELEILLAERNAKII